MRRDFQISILLTIAALPAGVAPMAAPYYFEAALKEYAAEFFWGGLALTATFISIAIIIAVRGEATEPKIGHKRRMIALGGMIVSGMGFLGFSGAYFWPTPKPSVTATPVPLPQPAPTQAVTPPPSALEPVAQQTQSLELKQIYDFFNGKDEWGLREVFDYQNVVITNIDVQKVRIGFIRAGRWKDFKYMPLGDGSMIFAARDGKFIPTPGGPKIVNDVPADVLFLILTQKYQTSIKTLNSFVDSGIIPESVRAKIVAFKKIIDENNEIFLDVLNEKSHQSQDYFLQYDKMKTPFYGVIVSEFARKFKELKPAELAIMEANIAALEDGAIDYKSSSRT